MENIPSLQNVPIHVIRPSITQLVLHVLCTSLNLTTNPRLWSWWWKIKRPRTILNNFPRARGGFSRKFPPKNKILITNTATWMPIFWRRYFLFKRARNVPPTLVLRAQCSTYLYTPNLHNHVRGTILQKLIVDSEVRGTTLQKLSSIARYEVRLYKS